MLAKPLPIFSRHKEYYIASWESRTGLQVEVVKHSSGIFSRRLPEQKSRAVLQKMLSWLQNPSYFPNLEQCQLV